jgi:hypothetical protein
MHPAPGRALTQIKAGGGAPPDAVIGPPPGDRSMNRRTARGSVAIFPIPAEVYACSTHPGMRRAGAGRCPVCGMPLVPWAPPPGPLRELLADPLNVIVVVTAMMTLLAVATTLMR